MVENSKKKFKFRELHYQSSSQLHSRFGAANSESAKTPHQKTNQIKEENNQIKIYKLKIKKQQPKHWVRGEQGKILSWTQLGGANVLSGFGLQICMRERDQAEQDLQYPHKYLCGNVTIPLTSNAENNSDPLLCGTAASTGSLALFFILNWETPLGVKFAKSFLPRNPAKKCFIILLSCITQNQSWWFC